MPASFSDGGAGSTAQVRELVLELARTKNALDTQAKELEARTKELNESLDHQMAVSEVLGAISRSRFELQPLLDNVIETAARLCGAYHAMIYRLEGDVYRFAAGYGPYKPEYLEIEKQERISPGRGTLVGRTALARSVIHIKDALDDPEYERKDDARLGDVRSMLGVPLIRDDRIIGVIGLVRNHVASFSRREADLVMTFADQAVIAIENARLFDELRQRSADLGKSLQQQTATADVLRTIANSPGELAPVFDAILAYATRLCGAEFGTLFLCEGDSFRCVALHNAPPAYAAARQSESTIRPGSASGLGRIAATRQVVHIADIRAEQAYADRDPLRVATVELAGARTLAIVPMLKDDELVGGIEIYRQEVRPFTGKQIDLVKNFASQAVIAIDNAHLLHELRERTRELTEALERQTATSEVLQVISRSPGELAPVFNTMLENTARICEADLGTMALYEDGGFRHVALFGAPPAYAELRRNEPVVRPHAEAPLGLLARTRQVVHVEDLLALPDHAQGGLAKIAGARTLLIVPLLKDQGLLGIIGVYRQEVRPFADQQIELVKDFANQAVIAIENARLLNELREALQQQTATADVLKVIGRSTFDLQSVLDTLTESAARLCDADVAHITRKIRGTHKLATAYGLPPELVNHFNSVPIEPGRGTVAGRVLVERKTVQMADALADLEFAATELQGKSGARTILGVPLLREGAPIGVIVLMRRTVRTFTDKQIELVGTFADQAVIAIENARLFEEVQARNSDLTALGEVGRAVSSTLDLNMVLKTIADRAVELSGADASLIFYFRKDTGRFELGETAGLDEQAIERYRRLDIGETGTGLGEAVTSRQPVQSSDITKRTSNPLRNAALEAGMRAALVVPLLGAEGPLGALVLQRRTLGEFPPAVISLMQSFADQSAIALENARLFDEIAQKSRELEIASAHKSRFVANMSHELRTPLAAILGYAELMEEGIYEPLGEQSLTALGRIRSNGKHLLGLINTVLDIAKIEFRPVHPEHGRLLHRGCR